MSRDDSGCAAWLMVALMLITLYAHVKISHSEIRDLQRRVGELEQKK